MKCLCQWLCGWESLVLKMCCFPWTFLRNSQEIPSTSSTQSVISRLAAFKEAIALDRFSISLQLQLKSLVVWFGKAACAKASSFQCHTEIWKGNSICNDFWGARKTSAIQSWLFHASCMYGFEEKSRVLFSIVLLTLSLEGIKEKKKRGK